MRGVFHALTSPWRRAAERIGAVFGILWIRPFEDRLMMVALKAGAKRGPIVLWALPGEEAIFVAMAVSPSK